MFENLNQTVYRQIKELCFQGDRLSEELQYSEAIDLYQKALSLIPKPIEDWEASAWILTAIGETYFFEKDYQNALFYLNNVMHCPNAIGNPLIHLRLGQVLLEIGDKEKAKNELIRAYMSEGEEIFENENSKYFHFIKKYLILK